MLQKCKTLVKPCILFFFNTNDCFRENETVQCTKEKNLQPFNNMFNTIASNNPFNMNVNYIINNNVNMW